MVHFFPSSVCRPTTPSKRQRHHPPRLPRVACTLLRVVRLAPCRRRSCRQRLSPKPRLLGKQRKQPQSATRPQHVTVLCCTQPAHSGKCNPIPRAHQAAPHLCAMSASPACDAVQPRSREARWDSTASITPTHGTHAARRRTGAAPARSAQPFRRRMHARVARHQSAQALRGCSHLNGAAGGP